LYDVAKLLLESTRIDHETELLGSNSRTVLCKAVETGHRKVIKLLLDDGRSDPNFLSSGETPLHYAVREGRLEAVRLLLADPRIDVRKVSALGITPIHLAARQKHKPMILKTLLQDGRADVNARNPRGETPLFTAVIANAHACVKLLLEVEGIDISTANNNGLTPMMAARSHHPPVSRAVVDMLKESIDKQNEKSRMEAQLLELQGELEKLRIERLELQARDLPAGAASGESEVQVQEVRSNVKRKGISRFRPRLTWLTRIFVRRRKANI
jgi:ankyrin repeat protein